MSVSERFNYRLPWQLLSFLALDPHNQLSILGKTKYTYGRKKYQIQDGESCLLNVLELFTMQSSSAFFPHTHLIAVDKNENNGALEELYFYILEDVLKNHDFSKVDYSLFNESALQKSDTWKRIRDMANKGLMEVGLWLNPPKAPLGMEEFFGEAPYYVLHKRG